MSTVHSNISIFVPHMGCPNMCSFCNQRYIAGTNKVPCETDIDNAVKATKNSKKYNSKTTEIAFFGGSFTAIERSTVEELLQAAYKYVLDGSVKGIRISTRPDAIDDEILMLLKKYGVSSIELGAQSMDDRVLKLNRRGHTANDVITASALIKKYGFELGLQMMTGLYGDNDDGAVYTANEFIKCAPDTVRIYPTILLENTDLAELYRQGVYKPQTLEEAVNLSAKLLVMFSDNQINVIRLGLHTIETEHYIAGPWHPAFSEIVSSRIYYNIISDALKNYPFGEYTVFVPKGQLSKAIGQHRFNITELKSLGYDCSVSEEIGLDDYQIKVVRK